MMYIHVSCIVIILLKNHFISDHSLVKATHLENKKVFHVQNTLISDYEGWLVDMLLDLDLHQILMKSSQQ